MEDTEPFVRAEGCDCPAPAHLDPDARPGSGDDPLEPEVERLHHRARAGLLELLGRATPAGHDVSAACTWRQGRTALPLDVAVHAEPGPRGCLWAPPTLCVDLVAPRPADRPGSGWTDADRRRRAYAGLGVDHVWQLDVGTGTLEVFVRAEDGYRHAETLTGTDWLDYGIGLVQLDLRGLLDGPRPARL